MVNPLAVPLALSGAASFAVSAVLQQRDARETPAAESLSWRLIADLLHRRTWLAGMGCFLLGFVFQATALSFAPVAVVEPLIATELVLALPLASRLRKRQLGPREWLGAAAVSIGVGIFMAVSSPQGGNPEPSIATWLSVGLPVVAAAGCAIALAGKQETPRRAVMLATAAGLCFALLALVLQSVVTLFARGPVLAFTSWQPYFLAGFGPMAFTVAQSAYQAAPLAISLPVIDSLEPTGAVVLSVLAFRQSLSLDPISLALESFGGLVALVGIFLLGRSPLVLSIYESQQNKKESDQDAISAPASRVS
jgi:drug/metabolite transporter (DMT)-like permease